MTHSQKDGNIGKTARTSDLGAKKEKFKFSKKGKFTSKEEAEIKRTRYNLFDRFSIGKMNINISTTTEDQDAARKIEKEEFMTKIRMKRDRNRGKAARMERLEVTRNKWSIRNICSSIVKELVGRMEPFMMEDLKKEVETLLLTLGLGEDRYARNAEVMDEEEEWLMETVAGEWRSRVSPAAWSSWEARGWGCARIMSTTRSISMRSSICRAGGAAKMVKLELQTIMLLKVFQSKCLDIPACEGEETEIYEPYMGKGDENIRRRRQNSGMVGTMVDRMENGEVVTVSKEGIGESRRWPVRKGEPSLEDGDVGGCSNQVGGRSGSLCACMKQN